MSDMGAPPPPPGGGAPPPPPPPGGRVPPPPDPRGVEPQGLDAVQASFGKRLGALLIDGLILGVPIAIAFLIVGSMVPTELVLCEDDTAICEQPTGGGVVMFLLVWAASLGVAVWYFGTFEGIRTQTVGKKALDIKTVRAGTDNEPLGFGRGVGRYFGHIASALVCYLGYFWMIWDPDSQTWHDKMVDSQVIEA